MQARSFQVRRQAVHAILHLLECDSESGRTPVGLRETIEAGKPFNLDAPRPLRDAAWDRQPATVRGYLLGICRDKLSNADLRWDEFVALGSLAADIEASN